MADHLRLHSPEGLTQAEIEDALAAIEAPWRGRVEREFRAVFKQELPAKEKSKAIVEKVREIGLQPYRAPQPPEPIGIEEIDLVCWMAVDVSS